MGGKGQKIESECGGNGESAWGGNWEKREWKLGRGDKDVRTGREGNGNWEKKKVGTGREGNVIERNRNGNEERREWELEEKEGGTGREESGN